MLKLIVLVWYVFNKLRKRNSGVEFVGWNAVSNVLPGIGYLQRIWFSN